MKKKADELSPADKPEVKTDLIELVKSFVPYITFLALAYAVISQSIYYFAFNINILEYTEVSEVLISTLIPFIVITSLNIVISLFYWYKVKVMYTRNDAFFLAKTKGEEFITIDDEKGRHTFTQQEYIKYKFDEKAQQKSLVFAVIMAYAMTLICFIYYIIFFDSLNGYFELILTISVIFTYLLIFVIRNFKKYYLIIFNAEPGDSLLKLMVPFLIIINFSICNGIFKISNIKSRPPVGSSITIGTKIITSTKDYYLIGRTTNYTVFYNQKNGQTDVYSNKEVSKLTIKE